MASGEKERREKITSVFPEVLSEKQKIHRPYSFNSLRVIVWSNGRRRMNKSYFSLEIAKSLETDEYGNFYCAGEASNENVDFQNEVTLQHAMKESKDYFLKNGVVSYDHRHRNADNPEEYIIGEPVDVWFEGTKTFVKFKLFRFNEIAQEIIKKLKCGAKTVKISIGGVFVRKMKEAVSGASHIVSFLWDEIALTYKPVNQTLTPVSFGKSLRLCEKLITGQVTPDEIHQFLKENRMDETTRELLKSISEEFCGPHSGEEKEIRKSANLEDLDRRGLKQYILENELDVLVTKSMSDDEIRKSIQESREEFPEEEEESVLEDIHTLKEENEDLKKSMEGLKEDVNLLASLVSHLSKSLKSPDERQSVVTKSQAVERFQGPPGSALSKEEVISKAMELVKSRKLSALDFSHLESCVNKGVPVDSEILKKLK